VYNLCSGTSYRIGEVLDMLLALAGVRVEVKQETSRMRPSDVPHLEGDYGKFHADTGWKPEIPFERSLKDLLDYWRKSPARR
jgi:GDP-4-dehydro-6-deoxy-D-mannose reductase